jgi:molecular chaperone HscB
VICWHCHEPTGAAVCVGCGTIQPPPATPDPFAVLQLKRCFHLDLNTLEDSWRSISRNVHPDRFAGKPAVMRRMSLQWTAAINNARRDLRDPDRRARQLATGNPNPPESRGAPTDPDFLELVFELQMDAKANPDGTRERALQLQDKERARLNDIFTAWESDSGNLDEVERTLGKIRYLQTAIHQTQAD